MRPRQAPGSVRPSFLGLMKGLLDKPMEAVEAAGIPYTVETEGVEQEDWQNGLRKYYHPMEFGSRLAAGALVAAGQADP